jgi:ABC-type transport system substrate-binding protein
MSRRLLSMLVIGVFVVSACSGDDDDGAATGEGGTESGEQEAAEFDPAGVLRYGAPLNGSGISGHLAPFASTSVCDVAVLAPIYDTLTHKDPLTGELEGGLAESWEVLDGETVELTLRQGATFHDGTPFDAEAVKAGLERNAAEDAAQTSTTLSILESVEVVNDLTVRIVLNTPAAGSLPLILSGREGMIVAPSATGDADTAPVGAGPFRLTGNQPGETVTLERFDGYWNAEEVHLGGVEIVGVEAGPPTVNALLGGEIDMSTVSPDLLEGLQSDPNIEVVEQGSETYYKLNWNLAEPPFDNLQFRQAVNHAIDRDAVLEAVFNGRGSVAWSPFPEISYGYNPDDEGAYEYDPDRARDLLEESGVSDPSFTAFTPPSPLFVRFGEVIQAQLAEVGIEIDFVQSSDIVQDYFTDRKQPATVILWPPRPDPVDTLGVQFTPGSFNNVGDYSNDQLNDLVSEVRATADEGEREPLLQEAVSLVVDEALDLPVVFSPLLHARTAQVGGEVVQNENCQGVDFTKLQINAG